MNTFPVIYSNHEYGESIYYLAEERSAIINELAELFSLPVEEIEPPFKETENKLDLVDVYNARDDTDYIVDGWEHLVRSVGLMTPGARETFEAFRAQMAPLDDVITVTEAADITGVSVQNIRASIERGILAARKSGGTWLLRRADVVARWGCG